MSYLQTNILILIVFITDCLVITLHGLFRLISSSLLFLLLLHGLLFNDYWHSMGYSD